MAILFKGKAQGAPPFFRVLRCLGARGNLHRLRGQRQPCWHGHQIFEARLQRTKSIAGFEEHGRREKGKVSCSTGALMCALALNGGGGEVRSCRRSGRVERVAATYLRKSYAAAGRVKRGSHFDTGRFKGIWLAG